MSKSNNGGQIIGFKYKTSLTAITLNNYLIGLTTKGMITRPTVSVSEDSNVQIRIGTFSMFTNPFDREDTPEQLVKVTTTEEAVVTINSSSVAIVYQFRMMNEQTGYYEAGWYGDFVAKSADDITSYTNGIVVCTITRDENNNPIVSTEGADISDLLLLREGRDPCRWLSLSSPRRKGNDFYKYYEVRSHNDLFDGYVSGYKGLIHQSDLYLDVTDLSDDYSFVYHDSEGIHRLDSSTDTLEAYDSNGKLLNTVPSNIIGIIDTTEGTQQNLWTVQPVIKEDVHTYYDEDNMCLRFV